MTKNKKRKNAVRAIALENGFGVARAGMLNDRNRDQYRLYEVFRRERSLAWTLDTFEGSRFAGGEVVTFHHNSDSPESLIWSEAVTKARRGTPHYLIDKGTKEQRFSMMNEILRQTGNTEFSYGGILPKENLSLHVDVLMNQHTLRLRQLEEYEAASFPGLRIAYAARHGADDMVKAPPYSYVFIYDWDEVMADVSAEVIAKVRFLMEHGKKTGMHFIVSTGGDYREVSGGDENIVLKSIVIQKDNGAGESYALINVNGIWTRLVIPNRQYP